jgi:hypothetical protein
MLVAPPEGRSRTAEQQGSRDLHGVRIPGIRAVEWHWHGETLRPVHESAQSTADIPVANRRSGNQYDGATIASHQSCLEYSFSRLESIVDKDDGATGQIRQRFDSIDVQDFKLACNFLCHIFGKQLDRRDHDSPATTIVAEPFCQQTARLPSVTESDHLRHPVRIPCPHFTRVH